MTTESSASTTPAHPLRPYYQPTSRSQQPIINHWLTPNASSSSSSSSFQNSLSSTSTASQSGNSLVNRSHSSNSVLSDDYEINLNQNPYTLNFSVILRGYVTSGLMAFTSAAIVMPFEVGKTLLQVQWIPNEGLIHLYPNQLSRDSNDDFYEEEEDDDNNLEAYFTPVKPPLRPSLGSTISRRSLSGSDRIGAHTQETNQWPEYILPVVVERGVMDMMRAIYKWRGEGFLALWKGQLTTFIIDTLSSNLQPLFLSTLFLVSSTPSSISLPLEHHAYPGLPLILSVSSYLITGLLLSPLDLVRTRLIVQSSQLRHRSYMGPIHGLRQIIQHEGGYKSIFLHPTLFFPAFLDNLLRPLFHLATPLIIDRFLAIDKSHEPIKFGLAEFSLSTAALMIILPLETIRKRLQLQSQRHNNNNNNENENNENIYNFKSCVHLRPKPYNGVVEAIYRIITEEKVGFWGLFRGFNVSLTANLVVFILSLIGNNKSYHSNLNPSSGGWAEV